MVPKLSHNSARLPEGRLKLQLSALRSYRNIRNCRHLEFQPISARSFSGLACVSVVAGRRQVASELPATDMAAAPGGGDAK